MKQTSIRIPTEIYEKIVKEAIEQDRSFSNTLVQIIKDYYKSKENK